MIYKKALVCKTKNLFSTSTAVGTLSGWEQSTARQFEEGKWYIGISGNNYYAPNNVVEYELTENYVYVNTIGNGYGIAKAFKCEPNQTYTVSCKWIKNTNNMNIATGFFDENGNWLSWKGADYLLERFTVTTPANCKWFTVCFVGTAGSTYVYNIQLEEGSTPTNYVPYGYLQSYKKAIKVSDICQLVPKYNLTYTDRGVTFTHNGDGSITINGTPTGAFYSLSTITLDVKSTKNNHKYLIYDIDYQPIISSVILANYTGGYVYRGIGNIYTFPEHDYYKFVFEIRVNLNQTANNIVIKPQLFDLTEMYGAGNEPKTIAEFRQKFPNELYPYRPYCFVNSYKKYLKIKEN